MASRRRMAGVFWDYENVPMPSDMAPGAALKRIKGHLRNVMKLEVDGAIKVYSRANDVKKHRVAMQHLGCDLIDPHTPKKRKEAVDMRIIVDMMDFALRWKGRAEQPVVVLLTGDCDYSFTLDKLENHGFSVYVISRGKVHDTLASAATKVLTWSQLVSIEPEENDSELDEDDDGDGGDTLSEDGTASEGDMASDASTEARESDHVQLFDGLDGHARESKSHAGGDTSSDTNTVRDIAESGESCLVDYLVGMVHSMSKPTKRDGWVNKAMVGNTFQTKHLGGLNIRARQKTFGRIVKRALKEGKLETKTEGTTCSLRMRAGPPKNAGDEAKDGDDPAEAPGRAAQPVRLGAVDEFLARKVSRASVPEARMIMRPWGHTLDEEFRPVAFPGARGQGLLIATASFRELCHISKQAMAENYEEQYVVCVVQALQRLKYVVLSEPDDAAQVVMVSFRVPTPMKK